MDIAYWNESVISSYIAVVPEYFLKNVGLNLGMAYICKILFSSASILYFECLNNFHMIYHVD